MRSDWLPKHTKWDNPVQINQGFRLKYFPSNDFVIARALLEKERNDIVPASARVGVLHSSLLSVDPENPS